MPHIRLLAFHDILASGIAGPIDVFSTANTLHARQAGPSRQPKPFFTWRVESPHGRSVRTVSGQVLPVDGAINVRLAADAVIVPGPRTSDVAALLARREVVQMVTTALKRFHQQGAILASFCSGSFLLAEAGLLDGRTATTHWALARDFEERYPQVDLQVAEIMTEQNRLICSGAVTTYLNLALRLVEKFAGSDIAAMTAKLLLIDTNRISQASYASPLLVEEGEGFDPLVVRAKGWMKKHLTRGFNLAELARHLAVSERTINRRFKSATGEAPLRYVQSMRVDLAKRLLETKVVTVENVSQRVGYGDISTFRQLFKRETGLSPRDYQRRFARIGSAISRQVSAR